MNIIEQLSLLVISLVANLLSALAGGGAGLLQLPILVFLGLSFPMALATHKIATVALGVGATIKHAQEKHTELRFALFMLLTGLPGVVLGANFILRVPENIALFMLGILTVGLGCYSYFKKQLGHSYNLKNRTLPGYIAGGLGLFILGIFNGSLTSGTGLFVSMWLILWFGLDYKRAVTYTMILVGMFWNGAGALTLALQTPVKWTWLPMLLIGSALGGYFGAALSIKYGNPLIKRVFECVTILTGLSLLYTSMT